MTVSASIAPRVRFVAVAMAICALTVGCGGHDGERAPPVVNNNFGGATSDPEPQEVEGKDCSDAAAPGCPCEEVGAVESCGSVFRDEDGYLACSIGEMTCEDDGEWGSCIGDTISILPIPDTGAN